MPQKVISQTAGRVLSSAISPFHFYLVRIAICSTCQGLAESKKEEALVGDVLGRSNSQGNIVHVDQWLIMEMIMEVPREFHSLKNGVIAPLPCASPF